MTKNLAKGWILFGVHPADSWHRKESVVISGHYQKQLRLSVSQNAKSHAEIHVSMQILLSHFIPEEKLSAFAHKD